MMFILEKRRLNIIELNHIFDQNHSLSRIQKTYLFNNLNPISRPCP
jgi:hypothetical protein